MKVLNRKIKIGHAPELFGDMGHFDADLSLIHEEERFQIYEVSFESEIPQQLNPVSIQWRLSESNIKGEWTTGALHSKRIHADWEVPAVISRVSVDAPVLCLFGHDDKNLITIACADAINTVEVEAPVREEDNYVYCTIRLFTEPLPKTTKYTTQIWVDRKEVPFYKSLQAVSDWWASFDAYKPSVPPIEASWPVYSTWYSYHQNFTIEQLLAECKHAADIGYKNVIIDDGWQTLDGGRGYDYTGDWEPLRIPNTAAFVDQVHDLGLKCMFWFSVPFCGKKSTAYRLFEGKFLTENHHWAPVFDPRYPDVREYLIGRYERALRDWKLDGLKLDFIDDFKTYPETILTKTGGRDYASVNAAVDRLLSDVMIRLKKINPDVLIEFRQKYIGPAMRKYGNMIRAFDCPNDALANRMRTTDVRLLAGDTYVHSDMVTWFPTAPVHVAALQLVNIIFSVPQLSVRLKEIPVDHLKMIEFYTNYMNENSDILLSGKFVPCAPLANYPVLSATTDSKTIYGVYEDILFDINTDVSKIDIVNGKLTERIAFHAEQDLGTCQLTIRDCMGNTTYDTAHEIESGMHVHNVPPSGLISINKQIN